MLQTDANRVSTISHRPLPQSPAEPDTYTAEARAVSIIAGRSPATLIKTTSSKQETPAPDRSVPALGQPPQEKHSSTNGKESGNNTTRYYANVQPNLVQTPRRSATAPDLTIKNNKDSVTNERGSKKRSNTSSFKGPVQYVVPEKESTKPPAKLGSKLDRFQKTTSKIFNISALGNVKGTSKKQSKSKTSKRQTVNPMERSWIEFSPRDQQMSWSHEPKDLSDVNTFASRKSTAPELPHLIYKSFLDDQTLIDEDEEDTEDSPQKERNDESGPESQITALPIVKDSTTGSYDDDDDDDDVAAEVASTYSARNRRFKPKNIHVPPLPKPKFQKSLEFGANNGHVIHQNRQGIRQKPSVFSFISSKKGQDTTSNSSVVKSRQDSVTSENQQPRPTTSASTSTQFYGEIEPPPPIFNSSWYTPNSSPLQNTETPPLSPTTPSNPIASALSATSETKNRPNGRKSISDINAGSTLDSIQKEIKKSDALTRPRNFSSSTTASTATHKPQHGGLRLFPRTPTTPSVRKFVSTRSLREFSAAHSASDITHLPRSRG
jgi:hypothetical protein